MKIYKTVLFSIIFFFGFCQIVVLAKEPVNIGIYKSGAGREGIIKALENYSEFRIETIEGLSRNVLSKYDVIIFANTTGLLATKEDPILNIINFVQSGGGVLFTHNACGKFGIFRESLFPQIAGFLGRADGNELHVVNRSHPITKELPNEFKNMYWDHIILGEGASGTVIIKNKHNESVVIAGKPSEKSDGRVVYMGNIPGYSASEQEFPPSGAELELLISSLKWLGSGKKKPVSLEETKATLMVERGNLFAAALAEKKGEIDFDDLPKGKFGWKGVYEPGFVYPGTYTPTGIRLTVAYRKMMGFNAIFKGAYNSGTAFYLSKLPDVPVFLPYKELNFDPLKALCKEAHKHKIQVFALLMPFSESFAGKPSEFISAHPEYIQISRQGKDSPKKEILQTMTSIWSCPDRPEVRERLKRIVKELVTDYDIDGISLDYIRYADGRACFCPYSIAKRAEFAAKHPELNEAENDAKFSEEMIVSIVVELRKVMDEVRPGLLLHAYTHPVWANKFPLNYHSKRVTSALWDTKKNQAKNGNWATLSQVFMSSKDFLRRAREYHRYTIPTPMVDFGGRKPAERVRKEIRTIARSGAKDISAFGSAAGQWFMDPDGIANVTKTVSEELGGTYKEIPWEDPRPRISAKPNLLPNSSFEEEAGDNFPDYLLLQSGKASLNDEAKYGTKSLFLEESGSFGLKEMIPVKAGEFYTLSGWIKVAKKVANAKFDLYLYFCDEDKKTIYVRRASLPADEFLKDWQRIEINRAAPTAGYSSSGKEAKFAQIKAVWRGMTGYLDAVKLEQYWVASDFE